MGTERIRIKKVLYKKYIKWILSVNKIAPNYILRRQLKCGKFYEGRFETARNGLNRKYKT